MKKLYKKMLVYILIVFAFILLVLPAAMVKWGGAPLLVKPGLITRMQTYFTTNVAETRDESIYPELQTPTYEISADDLWAKVQETVEKLNWEIESVDEDRHEIHAVVTTSIMQFKDDFIVRVKESGGQQSELYIQSSSRVGKGDLGANTGHVLRFLEELNRSL